MAVAKTENLNCTRCGGRIKKGETFRWYNRPRANSPFHVTCPAMEGAQETPEPQETATPEPEASTATVEAVKPQETASKPQETAPAANLATAITAAITGALAGLSQVTEDRVRAIVQEMVGAPPVTVEVKRPTGETVEVKGAHFMFARLCHLLASGVMVYLYGPAGTGKTTALMQAAKAVNGQGFELDTMDRSTFKSAILGYMDARGEYVSTPFIRGYQRGAVTIFDECDYAPAAVQGLLNTALANGHAPTANGLVERGEGFAFAGAGNTPMRPTPAYPDRENGAPAFMDRLYFMHWPQDPAIECRAAGLPCPKVPERALATCTPGEWVRWLQAVRAFTEKNAPTLSRFTGQRAALEGLRLLALGETPAEVADGLVFKGADPVLVAKVLAAHPVPSRKVEA